MNNSSSLPVDLVSDGSLPDEAQAVDNALLITHPDPQQLKQAQVVERLELLAEKPDIQISRQPYAQLMVKKVVRQKTIEIPVSLTEEVLIIEHSVLQATQNPDLPLPNGRHTPLSIRINGELVSLDPEQPLEIALYREEAQVLKTTLVAEQVDIGKISQQIEQHYPLDLRHEELQITEQATSSKTDS